ncbi:MULTISPECIES: guanitoxin biosynthesis heme-dependent pre-guanitoxin N-hydroxylase GntA [Deinococcus]|uniref:Guanitoxin biosynthesis heme-dependent pre-guanitoxin N-hydroxylase GntA n=1 Tax=Deinococcus rufus TaxID=2136097 RepID=A0ABV7Z5Q1_9DEIO|nr:guanitoxin biosynthesis heme-dependent pre-guanitoxin N-hydroxylase GntA [Deinococcus sp. AB2017081]WQE95431.1 guanitoxin biosynthesis heme-dependent pre-guanitoxin N-hydroxylase GntA [Deinococcus sp. AB2017081]
MTQQAMPTEVPDPLAGTYHLVRGGVLQASRGAVTPLARRVQATLHRTVLAPEFSCLAARAALNTSAYALGCYGDLGSEAATRGLAQDLAQFCADQDAMAGGFTSMIAVFAGPPPPDEHAFEERLWAQLRALHARDPRPYSPEVVADPQDPRFGFSFNGRGFFVIGLHPHSSRLARTFPYPALVFNAHRQFRRLRETGRFEPLQRAVRRRELAWQGSLNPNLANHGEASEARQYSGRAVEPEWAAPFPHPPVTAESPGRCPFGYGAASAHEPPTTLQETTRE